jgi:hypothetical protein
MLSLVYLMLVLHPHQIKRTYRRHTLPTTPVPVTPLTDTEAWSSSKDALKYFGSMPIPFQSWLENAILLIILFWIQYRYGRFGFWIDDNYSGWKRVCTKNRGSNTTTQPWIFLLEQTVFMVRGHIGLNNGKVPFSTKDNGGDLVETSFLCQGL